MDRLYRSEVPAIAKALGKQKTADEYKETRNHWAFLASVITNGALGIASVFSGRRPRMTSPDDFIDRDFRRLAEELFGKGKAQSRRKSDWASLIEDARQKGLNVPIG